METCISCGRSQCAPGALREVPGKGAGALREPALHPLQTRAHLRKPHGIHRFHNKLEFWKSWKSGVPPKMRSIEHLLNLGEILILRNPWGTPCKMQKPGFWHMLTRIAASGTFIEFPIGETYIGAPVVNIGRPGARCFEHFLLWKRAFHVDDRNAPRAPCVRCQARARVH